MMLSPPRLICVALFCAVVVMPCHAGSITSSASSASSDSTGSVSDSIKDSSNSSSGTKTADGDYRVIDVAEVADRPGVMQLTLRPVTTVGGAHEFTLRLPRQALEPRGIATGEIVNVRNRDYGLEFARTDGGDGREPFFLVLSDDWHSELEPRPVTL
jgi:hypothetical protein